MAIAANSRLLARLPRTAFQPGQSGNPRGRAPGTRNKVTREAREAAERLVDDPEYREALRVRMIDGTAGAMEALMWFYAKGKPAERVEQVERFPCARLTDEELRVQLLDLLQSLTPAK
ncbi:MAG: DUF5681 domain-containing protein [Acidobacteria bacterium]|nr:DUF5681 domain-containing protein [Acidobacteriota bacterium]